MLIDIHIRKLDNGWLINYPRLQYSTNTMPPNDCIEIGRNETAITYSFNDDIEIAFDKLVAHIRWSLGVGNKQMIGTPSPETKKNVNND